MKCVIDTNVLVSATMTRGGTCDHALRLVADGAVEAFVDRRILDKYERVLAQPEFRFDPYGIAEPLDVLRSRATLVTPKPLAVKLPHRSDQPFLEVASEAEAVLVTGNPRDFPRKLRHGVVVVSPAEFLDLLGRRS